MWEGSSKNATVGTFSTIPSTYVLSTPRTTVARRSTWEVRSFRSSSNPSWLCACRTPVLTIIPWWRHGWGCLFLNGIDHRSKTCGPRRLSCQDSHCADWLHWYCLDMSTIASFSTKLTRVVAPENILATVGPAGCWQNNDADIAICPMYYLESEN